MYSFTGVKALLSLMFIGMSSPMFIFTPLTILRPKQQYYHQCSSEPFEFVAQSILMVKFKRLMTLQLISNTPRISLIVPWLEHEKPIIMSLRIIFLAKIFLFYLIMTTYKHSPGPENIQCKCMLKNNCTVNNKLIKNSPQCNEGCIYTVPCKNCNIFYIGQTGITLEQRKKQHKYSVRTGQESNALFIHVRDTNYCIDWENCKKVRTSKSLVERNIIVKFNQAHI